RAHGGALGENGGRGHALLRPVRIAPPAADRAGVGRERRTMRSFLSGLVLLVLVPATVRGQSPAGAEFRINTYTTDTQYNVAVATDGNGDFVVVWASYAPDTRKTDVFGQRFSASGAPRGGEFQINTYTTSYQDAPAVAADANGNFVVVWESQGQDGNAFGIVGRRFDAAGVPQGTEF